jgi:hypothetical protein
MRSQFVYGCTHASAQAAAQGREGEASGASVRELPDHRRSSRHGRRATRLHTDAGGRGARCEPIDLRPAGAAAARDSGHAVGAAARSGRRAGAFRKGATPACSRARADGASGTANRGRRRARASHPDRARGRQEPAPDRPRPQREPHADRARRRAVVAVDGTGHSDPPTSAEPMSDPQCASFRTRLLT